jgi:hypothetical protein
MQPETIARFIENRSHVPNPKDVRFRKEVNVLVRLLLKWDMLEAIATHEAGHEIYFRKAGSTSFTYVPPTVVYREDSQEQPFDGQLARIIPENFPTEPNDGNWLFHLAKAYAAGGECARRLTTIDYGGDTIDRKLFKETCDDCYGGADADQLMDVEGMWKRAQNTVRDELNNSLRLRLQVQSRANEISPQLFPWTKYT